MLPKFALLIAIVFFLTLLLGIVKSRKPLWKASRHGRMLTLRSLILLAFIIVFLVFSLLR